MKLGTYVHFPKAEDEKLLHGLAQTINYTGSQMMYSNDFSDLPDFSSSPPLICLNNCWMDHYAFLYRH